MFNKFVSVLQNFKRNASHFFSKPVFGISDSLGLRHKSGCTATNMARGLKFWISGSRGNSLLSRVT